MKTMIGVIEGDNNNEGESKKEGEGAAHDNEAPTEMDTDRQRHRS